MKIDELIEKLIIIRQEYGDIPILYENGDSILPIENLQYCPEGFTTLESIIIN